MELLVLIGVVSAGMVWIVFPLGITSLRRRLTEIERRLAEMQSADDRIADLTRRVTRLERAPSPPVAAAPPVAVPAVPSAAVPTAGPREPAVTTPPRPLFTPAIAVPLPALARVPIPALSATPMVTPAPATVEAAPEPESWEQQVGANWLNKIGVLTFVVGLSLLLGYSMTHVGPAGRVAIGLATSVALLVAGVVLERRELMRAYAYGLIAGGWAGLYFTTYAIHAVPAARIIESDLSGAAALLAVAVAMIAHALRYRVEIIMLLAFVVGYFTLTLTPLSGFALSASALLTAASVIVSVRFRWTRLPVLSIAGAYGVFALRGTVFPATGADADSYIPFAALAAYWITFEVADIVAIRRRDPSSQSPLALLALNAAGFLGASALQLPLDRPDTVSAFLAVFALAYLVSLAARATMLRGVTFSEYPVIAAAEGSNLGALILAVALGAASIVMRYHGTREVWALLLLMELVFLAGATLGDRLTRLVGSIGMGLVAIRIIPLIVPEVDRGAWFRIVGHGTPVVMATAAVWIANREWQRARAVRHEPFELAYVPMAVSLLALVLGYQFDANINPLALSLFALVLVETGRLRGGIEYHGPAAVFLIFSAAWQVQIFTSPAATTREAWQSLPLSAITAYLAAWRLVTAPRPARFDVAYLGAAAVVSSFGATAIALLVNLAAPLEWRGGAWALLGLSLLVVGLVRGIAPFRWQGYALVFFGAVHAVGRVLGLGPAGPQDLASAIVAILALYVAGVIGRRVTSGGSGTAVDAEAAAAAAALIVGTGAGLVMAADEARPALVTLLWGGLGAVILAAGFPARERLLRVAGLGVLLLTIGRLFLYDLSALEPLPRILSFVVLGVVLLGVSWVYTRTRPPR